MSEQPVLLVGTDDGLWVGERRELEGHRVVDLAAGGPGGGGGWVALLDGDSVWAGNGGWERLAVLPGPAATCVVDAGGGLGLVAGTREAHLLRVHDGAAEPVASFDRAEGRDRWYTPWGGPPDTRTLATDADGTLYVNVHVGGIVRSDDGGETWAPTIDVDSDVHQVLVAGDEVLAATAYGLARSRDRGATWTFRTEGLHGEYSRAVAVAGEWLLLSSSTGPSTTRAAVYRRPLAAAADVAFQRCTDGLPEWFEGNVDTGRLVAAGETAAVAAPDGRVYVSEDAGASWHEAAPVRGAVTRLAIA